MDNQSLSADARAIIAVLRETESSQKRQIETILEAQEKLQDEVSTIARGFPDSDPDSHRRYHESIIEWRETRNRMVKEALLHAAKVGGVAAAAWVFYAIWIALKMEITR